MDELKIALAALGLDKLPAAKRDELIASLGDTLIKRVLERVLLELPEGEKENFEIELEGKDFGKILEFLGGRVPDAEEIIREEAGKLGGEIRGITG